MDRRPLTYVATFFLGTSIMRVVGFLLGYGNFQDKTAMFDVGSALSIAITVGVMSTGVLLYCTFMSLPSVHFIARKMLSHLAAAGLAVCCWRLYAQSMGSRIPGLIYANSKALIVAGAVVCSVALVLTVFYGEEKDETGA